MSSMQFWIYLLFSSQQPSVYPLPEQTLFPVYDVPMFLPFLVFSFGVGKGTKVAVCRTFQNENYDIERYVDTS